MTVKQCLSGLFLLLAVWPLGAADEHPLSPDLRRKIRSDAEMVVRVQTERLQQSPNEVESLSRRGDAHFFLGQFPEALADYDAMVRQDPSLDASHWRRGIACFYNAEYQRAAEQFERYHSFDNVDRENGIWRYLSQRKQSGLEEARRGLLRYEKDDREPFPDVFKLFAGTIEPAAIVDRIEKAEISESARESRRFYADLYIGLNHAVEGRDAEAQTALRRATANTWAPKAGYGPQWMWHVGRVHWELLEEQRVSASRGETR